MKVGKMRFPSGQDGVGVIQDGLAVPLELSGGHYRSLAEILESDDPPATIEFLVDQTAERVPEADVVPLSVIDAQEVWAAGVTYTRSRTARMAESAAAATHYDRVYAASRRSCSSRPRPAAWPVPASRCGFGKTRCGTSRSRSWRWCSIRGCVWWALRSATT